MKIEQYDQLKKIIQAANPEKFATTTTSFGMVGVTTPTRESITLADVLLAYRNTPGLPAGPKSPREGWTDFEWINFMITVQWNLQDDNLDHQSEETKQFLINLLVT